MNSIGERLKAARSARGLTQERLAAGIATKGFISQVERNQTNPSSLQFDWRAPTSWLRCKFPSESNE